MKPNPLQRIEALELQVQLLTAKVAELLSRSAGPAVHVPVPQGLDPVTMETHADPTQGQKGG